MCCCVVARGVRVSAGERVAGAGERAGKKEDGEREDDGEQAGEGGAALAALELCAGDVDAEAVARHDADHGCAEMALCEEPL